MTTDPLPNTPAHTILIHEAFGDHQVANVQTEVEARTIGASIYQPALTEGRSTDVTPFFGIPAIPTFPFNGSALVVWDHGCSTPASCPNPPAAANCTCPPPTTNTPPPGGHDPHEDPRNQPSARTQKSEFLQANGAVVDVCGGMPCLAP